MVMCQMPLNQFSLQNEIEKDVIQKDVIQKDGSSLLIFPQIINLYYNINFDKSISAKN